MTNEKLRIGPDQRRCFGQAGNFSTFGKDGKIRPSCPNQGDVSDKIRSVNQLGVILYDLEKDRPAR